MTLITADNGRVANGGLTRETVTRNRLAADPGVSRKRVNPKRLGADPGVSRKTVNRKRLVDNLRALGVPAARPLLVHASLSHIGHVRGGAETVIDALLEVLGPGGTLVTGAGTPENSTTSRAFQARTAGFTPDALERFCSEMPAFDRASTPTSVGAIAEALRDSPGAHRSAHPQSSFAAVGREARALMAGHRVSCHLGEASPLAKLYERDALILMIGVDYRACSAFHLAEYRYRKRPPRRVYSCVVKKRGKPRWFYYRDVALDDGDFEIIGKHVREVLEDQGAILSGLVGGAASCVVPMRRVVDLASQWMKDNRPWQTTVPGKTRPW